MDDLETMRAWARSVGLVQDEGGDWAGEFASAIEGRWSYTGRGWLVGWLVHGWDGSEGAVYPDELAALRHLRATAPLAALAIGEIDRLDAVSAAHQTSEPPPPAPSLTRADVVAWLRTAPAEDVTRALDEARLCTTWITSRTWMALHTASGEVVTELAGPRDDEWTEAFRRFLREDAEDRAIADGYRVPWREVERG